MSALENEPQRTARGITVWLTGLPAAGKSTIASTVAGILKHSSPPVSVLDGDILRRGLNAGLGFSLSGRRAAVRRAGDQALGLARRGHLVLVAMVSPLARDRDAVRRLHDRAGLDFFEIWVATPLSVCEARDPKGLYRRARLGLLSDMTGIDSPYEPPPHPDLVVATEHLSPAAAGAYVLSALGPAASGRGTR
jgi:bifunctional enzyme CysN/CysC